MVTKGYQQLLTVFNCYRAINGYSILESRPRKNFEARKIEFAKSPEARFPKVSRRSEPSSRGKRPLKVSQKFDPENFKQPKNREDSSDFDENLTESTEATRSRFRNNLSRRCRRRRGRWNGGAVKSAALLAVPRRVRSMC